MILYEWTACTILTYLTYNRQHLSYDDCPEIRRENNQNCCLLYCVWHLCAVICTHVWTVLKFACWFRFRFRFCVCVCLALAFLPVFILVSIILSCAVCFCCVGFSYFSIEPRDWLGRTSPKWPVRRRVGRKTLAQSMSQYLTARFWLDLSRRLARLPAPLSAQPCLYRLPPVPAVHDHLSIQATGVVTHLHNPIYRYLLWNDGRIEDIILT